MLGDNILVLLRTTNSAMKVTPRRHCCAVIGDSRTAVFFYYWGHEGSPGMHAHFGKSEKRRCKQLSNQVINAVVIERPKQSRKAGKQPKKITAMELEVDDKDLKAAGAEILTDGHHGLRIHGWEIVSYKGSILKSSSVITWEEKLETSHLPEMVFGESSLVLKHVISGAKIHFNAFDALTGWKKEALPPVEVPAAAQWKFRSKPFQQVILDYDYTFTTPYCGSETIGLDTEKKDSGEILEASCRPCWEDCEEQIDVAALASKEPILFYDEVVLYEDELADNGVSLLTVKVRVMPSCWFLLLRFWLRVDGVLMRLRDTRMHCAFSDSANPVILRESCWREATFQALAAKGYPTDAASYSDPSIISQKLPVIMHKTQKLVVRGNL